jgi:uncharacterized protein YjbI with pentapeptide repeats
MADLPTASFDGADLSGANLRLADFSFSDLTFAMPVPCTGAKRYAVSKVQE